MQPTSRTARSSKAAGRRQMLIDMCCPTSAANHWPPLLLLSIDGTLDGRTLDRFMKLSA